MGKLTTLKKSKNPDKPSIKGRLGDALRNAIRLRVEEALPILECCKRAGLSEAGWYKAMQRDTVKAYQEELEVAFISRTNNKLSIYRAEAVEVARNLMHNASSETVKMRAVEFFAAERSPSVVVNNTVNVDRGGYEYVQPGAKLVDIVDAEPVIEPD